jgi:transposase InsO family protein
MPWDLKTLQQSKTRFIQQHQAAGRSFAALCRRFGISRKTGYKWRRRFRTRGWAGLAARSQNVRSNRRQHHRKWHRRLRRVRLAYPLWGAKKLRRLLVERYGGRAVPHQATLGRWLQQWGLSGPRRRRTRRGSALVRPGLTRPRQSNDLWTVDFKGWFRTGDGTRIEPLTVRDLFSRFILGVVLLADQSYPRTRSAFVGLFRQRGLPRRIRVDNGGPFGSNGAAGLSRLSVWWMRLGIQVEFIRPAHPEDNGAHERMHRDYKAETARPPAGTPRGQRGRTRRFVRRYNFERPHEALGLRRPAQLYRRSRRAYPRRLPELKYPTRWKVRRVRSNGTIRWEGRLRFLGEAFVGQRVGLKPGSSDLYVVYFAGLLLGQMHRADVSGLRPATYARRRKTN